MRASSPPPLVMEGVLTNLVPSLVVRGVFGDAEFVSVAKDVSAEVGAQFASQILPAVLKIRLPTGLIKEIPFVVKIQILDSLEQEMRDSHVQFFNEVIMYQEILPFIDFKKSNLFPKMYYGMATLGQKPEDDILILENMKISGFIVSKHRLFLDYDHIAVVVKRLGEFHALSFTSKGMHRESFYGEIKKLKTAVFKSLPEFNFNELTRASISRGIKPLLGKNENDKMLIKFLEIFKSPQVFSMLLLRPEEPFAVISHGDFCKNNVFFKYDDEGSVVDTSFFDFQNSKYTSPAIDLSFFLYMHTSADLRAQHWDEFLKMYWDSVRENTPDSVTLPNFDAFLNDFAKRAVYAYFHCSFWAPMMLLEKPLTVQQCVALTQEEQIHYFDNIAGEEGLQTVTSIVSHFMEKQYINAFLKYYDENEKNILSMVGDL